ncbi:uncharacterized protein LOC119077897 [Bradysia coprophila]|uniref:uncharacterized protein LOC119077897 n=1 Tax=Bradysia coprophila TaxID=38358 RepID=UPI00187DA40E|nr:uncharacterized protein LOC119077897 [Bradysia coprophila]
MVKSILRLTNGPALLCIFVALISVVQALWSKFELISVENSKSGIFVTKLKVESYNKTAYLISGTIDQAADLNDDYDCEVKIYHSSKNNDDYKQLAIKVSREGVCEVFETSYWKGIEKDFQASSNIPTRVEDEKYCLTLKKTTYEMDDFAFNYNIIPKVLDVGTYKVEIIIYKKGSPDVSSMAVFVAKLF